MAKLEAVPEHEMSSDDGDLTSARNERHDDFVRCHLETQLI